MRAYDVREETETGVVRPLTPWMPNPTDDEIEAEIEAEEDRKAKREERVDDEMEMEMDVFVWDVKLGTEEKEQGEEDRASKEAPMPSPRVQLLN